MLAGIPSRASAPAMILWVVFPILLASALVLLRKRLSLGKYALAALIPLSISLAVWATLDDVYFYNRGPKFAAGVETWVFPFICLGFGLICAVPFRSGVVEALKVLVCVAVSTYCLFAGYWIS